MGGWPGMVCEYSIALGAERKDHREAIEVLAVLAFLGVFWVTEGMLSISAFGTGRLIPIGGGAAESNDDALVVIGLANELRVIVGLANEVRWLLSSPSRKIAGPML